MSSLACIVEGDGEVEALPILLRRMAAASDVHDLVIPPPIRVRRSNFLSDEGKYYRERYISLARGKARDDGAVLVLIDANGDCPAELATRFRDELHQTAAPIRISLVFAKCEFESWFIAAADSLGGPRIPVDELNPESIRNAKGWVRENIMKGQAYSPTVDQPSLAARFDWQSARRRSDSLDKLCREFSHLIAAGNDT